MRRIAMAVGDTAGHVFPALALAEAFRAIPGGAHVIFLGTADSIATAILDAQGERLLPVPGAPIRRAGVRGLPRALSSTLRGIAGARAVLARERVRLAIGFGGFASAGVLLAARSLGARTVIHEANAEPGLANAWLSRFVHRAYAAVPTALPAAMPMAVPVRASIAAVAGRTARHRPGTLRVLVTSGSRGAAFFASVVPAMMASLARRGISVEVTQTVDAEACESLQAAYAAAGITARIAPFFPDMAATYEWANVAITRAGANTLAELAIAGIPAVLVPLADAADDHQSANAQRWAAAQAALVVAESAWQSSDVGDWLARMATDGTAWQASSDAARRLGDPSAAQRMAADCDRFMQGHW